MLGVETVAVNNMDMVLIISFRSCAFLVVTVVRSDGAGVGRSRRDGKGVGDGKDVGGRNDISS